MATPAGPLDGDALLAAVSDAMSEVHERYYQRPPRTTRARMMGTDLLACVLGGVYTDVEKTLIELERGHVVRETAACSRTPCNSDSSTPSNGSRAGRVEQFISSHNIGPDLEIELFFLAAR
jgi:hypothetical protein